MLIIINLINIKGRKIVKFDKYKQSQTKFIKKLNIYKRKSKRSKKK